MNIYYKSYDKRKDLDFAVINYPNLKGNVPINPSYGVFTSQLIRFSSLNQYISDFISYIKGLIIKVKHLGYNSTRLRFLFQQFAKYNPVIWSHFGIDISKMNFVLDIFGT